MLTANNRHPVASPHPRNTRKLPTLPRRTQRRHAFSTKTDSTLGRFDAGRFWRERARAWGTQPRPNPDATAAESNLTPQGARRSPPRSSGPFLSRGPVGPWLRGAWAAKLLMSKDHMSVAAWAPHPTPPASITWRPVRSPGTRSSYSRLPVTASSPASKTSDSEPARTPPSICIENQACAFRCIL